MIKVAITGSTGLIGSRIIELLGDDFEFIPLIYPRMDITNRETVSDVLKEIDFDIFLHLAAYTNVDGAETEKNKARKLNIDGTRNVFNAVQKREKKFIYISTGFVFDGENPPYYEDSKPNPTSYYGETKYRGEQVVKGDAMIVRIEYPYRKDFIRGDFVRTLKNLLQEGKTVNAVTDMVITPTFIDDVAFALKHLMNNFSNEIFHIVGADSQTPYNATRLIAKTFNLDASLIKDITREEFFKGRAIRPRLAEIKSKKNNFYKMRGFEEGLRLMI